MFNILLNTKENRFIIKGNIFQYVNTEDNADIVINTGNP
ncbi:hypothetical protein h2es_0764 [Rickettsiales endosymbiont of Trichoplax sp. H2]|nr:hypothetical protein [Rickettsiales endosymbiont of Trichoplax sp. H2]